MCSSLVKDAAFLPQAASQAGMEATAAAFKRSRLESFSSTVSALAVGVRLARRGVREEPRLVLLLEVPVDVLGLLELLQAFLAQLAPAPGGLVAAERARVVVGERVVDPDRAGLDLFEEPLHLARV